jgi:hypothetical protein|tara:strand:- start:916 stop:1140 length:225 start_codon:yes stop_codon:yes gene_type:complete
MNIGDLVKNLTEPEAGLGLVVAMDIPMFGQLQHDPPGVKVRWRYPTSWVDGDGISIMYDDEVEVINEARRSNII